MAEYPPEKQIGNKEGCPPLMAGEKKRTNKKEKTGFTTEDIRPE